MLTQSKQKRYFKKRRKKLIHFFRCFNDQELPEYLHKMRLETKKVRAFVLMLQQITKNGNLQSHTKTFRKIFKHAGIIRTAQLNIKLIDEHQLDDLEFFIMQTNLLDFELRNFRLNHYEYYDQLNHALKSINREIVRIKVKDVRKFFKNLINELDMLISGGELAQNLHLIRKKIKTLIYIYGILPKQLKKKVRLNAGYLDELQELIGDWHDYDGALNVYFKHSSENTSDISILQIQSQIQLDEIVRLTGNFKNKIKNSPKGSINQRSYS